MIDPINAETFARVDAATDDLAHLAVPALTAQAAALGALAGVASPAN
jgi:hypothetical protein